MLRLNIKEAKFDKLKCATEGCGKRITEEELADLFKDDEPEVLEKLEMLR